MSWSRRAFCLAAFALLTAAKLSFADWPGFRGPAPAELSAETLPVSWSPSEHIRWKAEVVGDGQSSPVIWQDHVYLTSVEGPNKDVYHVLAFNLKTGEKLWQQSVQNASPIESSNYVSKAAPTPIVSEQGVVVLFEGGNLLAFQHDGTQRWARNLVEEYGSLESRHGLSSSLLQSGNRVIVWIERENDPYILAINPETGENLWKVEGLGVTSWSTPIVLTVDGKEHFVFSGMGLMRGIDPENGSILWKLAGLTGNATPSPSAVGDGRLLIGATDGRGEGGGGKAADSNGLVQVTRTESGEYEAKILWRAKRATCSFGSPIAHDGLAYFVNRTGIVFCLDLETGEEVYAERTPESCWATPLAVGDHIYLVGQKGTTTVIKSGRQFEVVSENRLWEKNPEEGPPAMGEGQIQYAVAAIPGSLLIRTGEHLYCVER
ncbi:PQQ-binding-like beta-propeller repeat protein [Planctomicrobium sp. SH661]|uniref:PQQ-binding-like beta-propeller repeat protein n=1 Tax=Planctomicrobium sp. SH661 TaxID=3448124 RepID=UPI003F5BCA62